MEKAKSDKKVIRFPTRSFRVWQTLLETLKKADEQKPANINAKSHL